MANLETRYAALLARCSDSAKRHLGVLTKHPLLPEMADALDAKQGTLRAEDIEDCFLEVAMKHARLDDKVW